MIIVKSDFGGNALSGQEASYGEKKGSSKPATCHRLMWLSSNHRRLNVEVEDGKKGFFPWQEGNPGYFSAVVAYLPHYILKSFLLSMVIWVTIAFLKSMFLLFIILCTFKRPLRIRKRINCKNKSFWKTQISLFGNYAMIKIYSLMFLTCICMILSIVLLLHDSINSIKCFIYVIKHIGHLLTHKLEKKLWKCIHWNEMLFPQDQITTQDM